MDFNSLITKALNKAGKQETLATYLDLGPSELNKRINGQVGWQMQEIDKILEYTDCQIVNISASQKKINALKETLKIILEEDYD